ncbi:Carbohydrate binding module (family 6) [Mucilaginibacter pineti]|uniref:Carbohydrate binding module (Family 6) n=1 Tax=Mucilaginibacter pineti TaxID=1391627 RepID=A0A1G7FE56_9SPHI|nr:cellulase family glycosylhydrolase [Mucilaginibacter pineti]SDE74117.1 Carbohydrate binding module (family 6) [Mucilaginibacter pineti]
MAPMLKTTLFKQSAKGLLMLLFVLIFSIQSNAQGFLKTKGTTIVNQNGKNVLLRGMGLGGWMLQEGYMLHINEDSRQYRIRERLEVLMGAAKTKEFYDAWLLNGTRKIDVDSMRRWGFNSIRLPMHYNLYTLPVEKEPVAGKNTWINKGFEMTDKLLAWCKANHMYLILDMHATPGGQGNDMNISDRNPDNPSLWNSEANKQKMIALWRKLAERYKNEPNIAGYDIINEPNWGFDDPEKDKNGLNEKTNAPLRKLMVDITTAIREADKKHIIIIEGNGWGNNYNGILPAWDNNMVLSFHKYWNYNDEASIKNILSTRNQYNIPVWLGETGENSNVWLTEAIRLLEKNNIGWALWPLKKMGNNNPIEIPSNPNYDAVANYMNTGKQQPDAATTYAGTMELAKHAKLENAIIHHDVIDAILRQPFTTATKPFKNNIANGSSINAVDYDMGRNGFAYFDTDTADYHISTGKYGKGNAGGVYRNDGVDISKDSTRANGYYIDNIEEGEWLQYTVKAKTAGKYAVKLTVASGVDNAELTVGVNGVEHTVVIPNKGANTRQIIPVDGLPLKTGINKVRVFAKKGGYVFYSLQIIAGK